MTKKRELDSLPATGSGVVFSDLLRGLGDFMEVVSQALDESGHAIHKSGEFSLDNTKRLHGLYGVKINVNEKGLPNVERFGTFPGSDIREPIVDVFNEDHLIRIVAEMPGIEEQDITTELTERVLFLNAKRDEWRYAAEIEIPDAVTDILSITCRMGITEIELQKVQSDSSEWTVN